MAPEGPVPDGAAMEQASDAPQQPSEARPAAKAPANLRNFLSLEDFERAAERHLPRMLHGFISGACETDASLRDNRDAFAEWGFVPRVLVDTAQRDTVTELLGRRYAAPFGIAPMGASALSAYRGDLVFARSAAAAAIPMILSGSSLIPMEEVRAEGPTAWYQAYLPGEIERIEPLVDRVAEAGFDTFVLTVDVPVSANRENNVRNGYSLPLRPTPDLAWQGITHPGWLFGTALRTLLNHGMPHFENMDAHRGPPVLSGKAARAFGQRDGLSWEHLEMMRARWPGHLVVKGIMSAEDARIARDSGADGVIVSNHGGRQLDGTASPLRVLPQVAAEAQGMAVMLDGGIRRGTDILKALALGADFVFIGRPFICAAAVRGENGVRHAITLLWEELLRNMAMLGVNGLHEVGPQHLLRLRGG